MTTYTEAIFAWRENARELDLANRHFPPDAWVPVPPEPRCAACNEIIPSTFKSEVLCPECSLDVGMPS